MSLELPTVTALGTVSTGCVESSSEIFSVLSVPVVDVPEVPGVAEVYGVVVRG